MRTEVSPALKVESRAGEIYAVNITFFVIAIVAVCLKLIAARISRRKLRLDDGLAIAGGIFVVGHFICMIFFVRFGLGRHKTVVDKQDPSNVTRFFKTIIPAEILYPLCLGCTRLSLATLYCHVFRSFKARYYLYGIIAFIIAWVIYSSVPAVLACRPVDDFWKARKHCIDHARYFLCTAAGSIATDFALIILPIPYIPGLRLPLYKKALLLLTFVFGGFDLLVVILKPKDLQGPLFSVIRIDSRNIVTLFDFTDPTWGTVDLLIWSALETYCGVICCCLPTLWPLFHMVRSNTCLENFVPGKRNVLLQKQVFQAGSLDLDLKEPPRVACRTRGEVLMDYDFIDAVRLDTWFVSATTSR
ncbi:hypothetical protein CCHL11_06792 [Colletotrichum chlorophyti]|uniref:Rhodopsin domain-containing protein n=1 Tax=Colletotrichum chlorophyti TaxID=708187 RepID=A0A1Q8S985_9PEZI|nr:hypothetical protein CCHL11_06792 [Colletotrichum chlorophyti]